MVLTEPLTLFILVVFKSFLPQINPSLYTDTRIHARIYLTKEEKTNLAGTLVHSALKICSPEKFSWEISKIKNNLRQNGYPEEVIVFGITKKVLNIQTFKRFGSEKCLVYLKLP